MERALSCGINGLVGGVLEGAMWENIVASEFNTLSFAVEGNGGMGEVCFGKSVDFLNGFVDSTDFLILRRSEPIKLLWSQRRFSQRRRYG
jgi:hypothetical protein